MATAKVRRYHAAPHPVAQLGPFQATARTRERIDIPAPVGWMLVIAGSGLLLARGVHQVTLRHLCQEARLQAMNVR